MITRITPDFQKAKSLVGMSKVSLERLEETDKEKYPSNTLIDYYDILHKLMDAILLSKGIKFMGDGAHREMIDYLFKEGILDEHSRAIIQQMRDFRNRIQYEGFTVHKNFIILNEMKIKSVIRILLERL